MTGEETLELIKKGVTFFHGARINGTIILNPKKSLGIPLENLDFAIVMIIGNFILPRFKAKCLDLTGIEVHGSLLIRNGIIERSLVLANSTVHGNLSLERTTARHLSLENAVIKGNLQLDGFSSEDEILRKNLKVKGRIFTGQNVALTSLFFQEFGKKVIANKWILSQIKFQ